MRDPRLFSSYVAAGVLTAALTALLFPVVEGLAFFTMALTPGIARRDARLGCAGSLWFVVCGVPAAVLAPVLMHAEWWYFERTWVVHAPFLLAAVIASAVSLPERPLSWAALGGGLAGTAGMLLAGRVLGAMPASDFWRVYTTLVASVPIVGVCMWLPVQVAAGRHPEPRRAGSVAVAQGNEPQERGGDDAIG